MWTARVNARSTITPGNQIELGVDTANLHFFDADSGLAVRHPHADQAPC
jgi:multiple sugar transport system ATP-binding protein